MQYRESDWGKIALFVAAVFHLIWGGLSLVYPTFVFSLTGAIPPQPIDSFQALGLYSLVMGVGFLCASTNPTRHWPVVLMGLLISVALTLGFIVNYANGQLPGRFFWVTFLHDVLWIVPFAWILHEAHEYSLGRKRYQSPEIQKMALRARTSEQMSLAEMTTRWPTLLVFLRHFGCTFCREALADLAERRAEIEKTGTRIALVHMGSDAHAEQFFTKYGLGDLPRISDPQCALYRAFGLTRGSLGQLFGWKVWLRGFQAGILRKHGVGMLVGDGFQMPGIFLLFHGEVLNAYVHQSASDRPNYVKLLEPAFADEPLV